MIPAACYIADQGPASCSLTRKYLLSTFSGGGEDTEKCKDIIPLWKDLENKSLRSLQPQRPHVETIKL